MAIPPTAKPLPIPVSSPSRAQGFWCIVLKSSNLIDLTASPIVKSTGVPPAVLAVPPGMIFAGSRGRGGIAPSEGVLEDCDCLVSSAIARIGADCIKGGGRGWVEIIY